MTQPDTSISEDSDVEWVGEENFFDAMDANPQAVYVVEMWQGFERFQMGIFTTKAQADTWCQRPEFDDMSAVICPYVIDDPDFGNVRTS